MCGIFFSISRSHYVDPDSAFVDVLRKRGPDSVVTTHRRTNVASCFLSFTSTVLSLRGDSVVAQPYEDDGGAVLCWNGEAWSVNGEAVHGNDTQKVFHLLHHKASHSPTGSTITERLARLAGPYAFVYFDNDSELVFLARDHLGRRSLLWSTTDEGDLLISSVSTGASSGVWNEIDADGVYCIDLSSENATQGTWGSFMVSKKSYIFHNENANSVIPRLALNKALSTAPLLLSQHSIPVSYLQDLLTEALRKRVLNIPDPPKLGNDITLEPSRLAVLFSGGLDCTVLARITHDLLPEHEPIDLLNVAFENPRIHKDKSQLPYELCPDRMTGRAAFQELSQLCPTRPWRLVAINVPYEETLAHRESIVSLMYPHNTEMDLSISCALYFASRGSGLINGSTPQDGRAFTTSARVLLSGLGADELFAGYTRHATAFRRNGFDGLFDELDLDVGRLGKRNLGRDDRIISNWSKEVRFPYLDEALVQWALEVPITDKTGYGERVAEAGADESFLLEPGKKVLRCLAWKLGMTNVAREKKRAIQFGTRTAKMETNKTKGTTLVD